MARKFRWRAVLPLIASAIYGVAPIDLIPDLIPLLGWSDDVAVAIVAVLWAVRLLRRRQVRRNALTSPR